MPISTHNIREFWGQNFYRHSANVILFVTFYVFLKRHFKKNVKKSHVFLKSEKTKNMYSRTLALRVGEKWYQRSALLAAPDCIHRECLSRAVTHVCVLTVLNLRVLFIVMPTVRLRWRRRWIMMTAVIDSDYVSHRRSDWFFLVLAVFWQIIRCSLQTKTNKKCVLWQRNRTMPL